jgi:uncharacterized membrane protein
VGPRAGLRTAPTGNPIPIVWGATSRYAMLSHLNPLQSFNPCIFKAVYARGRVNKQVTHGSKTAVLDVIGFLCVSLGSSTVQLHDSLGSRRTCAYSEAGFSSQNGDRI